MIRTIVFVFLSLAPFTAAMSDKAGEPLSTVPLQDLVESLSQSMDRQFLIDMRVPARLVSGTLSPDRVNYEAFLIILRNNDLAAVSYDGVTNIVPVQIVRQYPLPVISEQDDSIAEEEWVTWVVQLKHSSGRRLVPIIRPLLPQAGHMAADPDSKTIILADRYANARRVVAMIRRMDVADMPAAE